MDLHIDPTGDVSFDGGDLNTVTGIDLFNQRLGLHLHHYFLQLIGGVANEKNLVEQLRVQARRVVEQSDSVVAMTEFEAVQLDAETMDVHVQYMADREMYMALKLDAKTGPQMIIDNID